MSRKRNRQVSDILVNEKSDINSTLSNESVAIKSETVNFVVYKVKDARLESRGSIINLEAGEGSEKYDVIVTRNQNVSTFLYERIDLLYKSLGTESLSDEISVNMDEINKIDERLYYHTTARAESCEKMLFKSDDRFVYKNLLDKFPTPKSKI